RLMYYHPRDERVWTGDIFATGIKNEYVIVMTPACDFAQNKVQRVMICYGNCVNNELIETLEFPLYKKDPMLVEITNNPTLDAVKKKKMLLSTAKRRYIDGKNKPARFYLLHHFVADSEQKPVTLCFDFQEMSSLAPIDLNHGELAKDWKRISRLDSPYMEIMLQNFGAYLSRIGAPSINSPIEDNEQEL
ncbi:MAG: hypothetical protein JRN52_10560, partial [Nitrososphaerota archaeon]|nr:hypothetical protein [Nitrososphaerota archaeon]